MVSQHPAKLGGHRHCGSGDMMFVVVEGKDSTCPPLDPPSLKHMTWSHTSTRTIGGT